MSLNGNNILSGASGQTTGYDIEQSLRFNDGDSPYLTRQFTTSGNRKTYTFSVWAKRGAFGDKRFFGADGQGDGTGFVFFQLNANDKIEVGQYAGGYQFQVITTPVYRDASSWYHIVFAVDTTQSTASDRIKIYVNGEQVTSFDTTSYPSLDYVTAINGSTSARPHGIGYIPGSGGDYDGYMAEAHFIDGQALTPASFGETNEDTNQWQAIEYDGSYGTNGFYLKFQDSSALGDDSSGNTNDFTPTNLVATDQVLDSPTNNFATLNSAYKDASVLDGTRPPDNVSFAEGNLSLTATSGNFGVAYSTMTIPASGKWYLECYLDNGDICGVGIVTASGRESVNNGWGMGAVTTAQGFTTQDTYVRNSQSNTLTLGTGTPSDGDIYQLAIDADNNKVWIGLNNSWNDASGGTTGNPSSGTNHTIALTFGSDAQIGFQRTNSSPNTGMVANFGQDSSFAGNKTAQGNQDGNGIGDFYYTPPSGFVALCSDNLSDPSIADPTAYFNTVLYTGNGSTLSVSGVGFSADLTWLKNRDTARNHNLTDTVRGVDKYLSSDTTDDERTGAGVQSWTSDGFTLGSGAPSNDSGNNYVAWNWKAGGTASSNTDGTITSSVSANTDAGFSIVSFTGNGTAGATVGHGLSQAPEFWVTKNRDSAYAWFTGTPEYPNPAGNYYIQLDASMAAASNTGIWNGTLASSSVITLGNLASAQNNSGDAHIAYCFHSVDGYSKVGSYTGNGSSDGTFIYTGFKPSFLLVRSTAGSRHWFMHDNKRDPYNYVRKKLYANLSNAEPADTVQLDFVSNGFKARVNDANWNGSGETYIYLAFAESPFKTSNAR